MKESAEIDFRRACGDVVFNLAVVGEFAGAVDVKAVMKVSWDATEEEVMRDSLVRCLGTDMGSIGANVWISGRVTADCDRDMGDAAAANSEAPSTST